MRIDPPAHTAPDSPDDAVVNRYSETYGLTQTLERDIIDFLSAKYTGGATISLGEVMSLYHCPPDRARRVIASLVTDEVLVAAGGDVYRVTI